jgi:hypothetical protein
VFGIARELTGSSAWAGFAALLVGRDARQLPHARRVPHSRGLRLPWIALHFWCALRLARTSSWSSAVLAGLTALAAAATWHAAVFVLLMEAVCLVAWFARSGENALSSPKSWLAVAIVALGSLAIPVLRAKQFVLSLPVIVALALVYVAWLARRKALVARSIARALRGRERAPVRGLESSRRVARRRRRLLARVRVARGQARALRLQPADPRQLDFGARLLWQGPFRTADWHVLWPYYTAGALAALASAFVFARAWRTGRGDGRIAVVLAFTLLAALAMWLVERTGTAVRDRVGFARGCPARATSLQAPRVESGPDRSARARRQPGLHALDLPGGDGERHAGTRILWYAIPPSGAENDHVMRWIAANVRRASRSRATTRPRPRSSRTRAIRSCSSRSTRRAAAAI